jgi:LAS superfamily LD-carboxypeptidase LdcB
MDVLQCSFCVKPSGNPVNNFVTKWKYKQSKPSAKKTTKKQRITKTVYHFPLSSVSFNTANPTKAKQTEENTKEVDQKRRKIQEDTADDFLLMLEEEQQEGCAATQPILL